LRVVGGSPVCAHRLNHFLRGPKVARASGERGLGCLADKVSRAAGEITDKLLDAVKALSLDRIFAQVDWGGLPAGLVEESIGRYAAEIAPALRAV
jgi:hypothetical protein